MLGHLPERIKEANRRLHRLYSSSAPLESKALAIQSSIWPATFFGTHSLAPGRQRLQTLRGNAARVLAAALFLLPTVQDPEPFIMLQQARLLRRAFKVMPDVAESVLAMAAGSFLALPLHCAPCLNVMNGPSWRMAGSRALGMSGST